MKYKSIEFRPGKWKIIDKSTNVPIYDNEPDGEDKPIIFEDEDIVLEYVRLLNRKI